MNRPADWYEEMHNPLPSFFSRECLRYEAQQRENGVFEIGPILCKDIIYPTLYFSSDNISAPDLITRMEKLWETSKTLDDCRYLPDIDIQTPEQRCKAGLPPTCMVWLNAGDQVLLRLCNTQYSSFQPSRPRPSFHCLVSSYILLSAALVKKMAFGNVVARTAAGVMDDKRYLLYVASPTMQIHTRLVCGRITLQGRRLPLRANFFSRSCHGTYTEWSLLPRPQNFTSWSRSREMEILLAEKNFSGALRQSCVFQINIVVLLWWDLVALGMLLA